jgi:hypothetical protein
VNLLRLGPLELGPLELGPFKPAVKAVDRAGEGHGFSAGATRSAGQHEFHPHRQPPGTLVNPVNAASVICGRRLESGAQNAPQNRIRPFSLRTSRAGSGDLGICGQTVHGLCKPIYESNQLFKHYNRF